MTNYDKAIGTTYLGWADYDQINYVSMNDLAAGRRPDFLGYSQMSSPLKIASFAYIFLYGNLFLKHKRFIIKNNHIITHIQSGKFASGIMSIAS